MSTTGGREFRGHLDTEIPQERNDITRPADRNRDCPDCILEREIPADNPREKLPESHIAIGVSTTRHGYQGGKFTVTERGESRGGAGENEREHYARTCIYRRRPARQDENASADNRTDA